MDKSTRIVLLQRWSAEVAACNQSGMSKGDWCRENGVNPKTFYYHQRMVCRAAFEALPISAEEQEVHFLEIPQAISAETTGVSSPGAAPRRARLPAPVISGKPCSSQRATR